ncbi:hypothetical protein SAMN05444161_3978 [Rhizobiales bacterium GAS191]|jgi:hypothetical protein|nr:hypothetical protein SAMN05519103_03094 [Rhizobiales bacterium GAS113]SED77587.1 hypothetical protein SAMN05444161_3978 [Rhizobiales bacterium GAS191]SEE68901.1 hypothetical protein SAMN05519104_7068 [Rhizobiales bacterium GAS188]
MTELAFVHQASPTGVVFEPGGLARLEAEAADLNLERVLVLSTPQQGGHAEQAASALGPRLAGTFSGAAMLARAWSGDPPADWGFNAAASWSE